jgi:hypothetical protein
LLESRFVGVTVKVDGMLQYIWILALCKIRPIFGIFHMRIHMAYWCSIVGMWKNWLFDLLLSSVRL